MRLFVKGANCNLTNLTHLRLCKYDIMIANNKIGSRGCKLLANLAMPALMHLFLGICYNNDID